MVRKNTRRVHHTAAEEVQISHHDPQHRALSLKTTDRQKGKKDWQRTRKTEIMADREWPSVIDIKVEKSQ